MFEKTAADQLGHARCGDVDLRCHFAFGDCKDAPRLHWGRLRVANSIELGAGESLTLAHEEATEILTYVVAGSIRAHNGAHVVHDRLGETLNAGDLHGISTGAGVESLAWRAGDAGASLLQFWLIPEEGGGNPASTIRRHCAQDKEAGMTILASGFAEDDPESGDLREVHHPVPVKTCARLMYGLLPGGGSDRYDTMTDRKLYIAVIGGTVSVDGRALQVGDRACVSGEVEFLISSVQKAEFLVIDSD